MTCADGKDCVTLVQVISLYNWTPQHKFWFVKPYCCGLYNRIVVIYTHSTSQSQLYVLETGAYVLGRQTVFALLTCRQT